MRQVMRRRHGVETKLALQLAVAKTGVRRVAPRIDERVRPTCGLLPLLRSGNCNLPTRILADPIRIRSCVVQRHIDHRMVSLVLWKLAVRPVAWVIPKASGVKEF